MFENEELARIENLKNSQDLSISHVSSKNSHGLLFLKLEIFKYRIRMSLGAKSEEFAHHVERKATVHSSDLRKMNISEAKANLKHLVGQLSIYTKMETQRLKLRKLSCKSNLEVEINVLKEEASQVKDNSVQEELKKVEENRKVLVRKNAELKKKILDLEAKTVKPKQEDSFKKNDEMVKSLESASTKLQKKISVLEKQIAKEREEFEKEGKTFAQKFSDFSRKSFEEKKLLN
ncbi:hypothetical protein L6452_40701 [Arctium lappa]|uniref:Uncharacterized protein n=1 Tax=Arctium lappa TaxID=4217 RepID=A0ACB8XMV7_ARCLA|nr:hypothetical protein L6452_40701 [Arctium lappa]